MNRRGKKLNNPADQPVNLSLAEEINMLRYAMKRVFACAQGEPQQDLATWGNALTLLSTSASRLARLLKTHSDLNQGQAGDVLTLLHQALRQIESDQGKEAGG